MGRVCWLTRAAILFAVVRFRCISRNLALALWLVVISVASVATAAAADQLDSLRLLGREIDPGTGSKFSFISERSFEASYLNMPVFVARGLRQGPTLCLTAGIHGDESIRDPLSAASHLSRAAPSCSARPRAARPVLGRWFLSAWALSSQGGCLVCWHARGSSTYSRMARRRSPCSPLLSSLDSPRCSNNIVDSCGNTVSASGALSRPTPRPGARNRTVRSQKRS